MEISSFRTIKEAARTASDFRITQLAEQRAVVEWKITIVAKEDATSEVVVECPNGHRLNWRTGRFE